MTSPVLIGGVAVLLSLAGFALFVLLRGNRGAPELWKPSEAAGRQPTPVASKRDGRDPSPLLTGWLDRLRVRKRLQWHLLQAGLLVRPSELAALMLGMVFLGFAMGFLLSGFRLAWPLAAVGGWLPVAYVAMRKGGRRRALINQLADALGMVASSLRSGYSFMRAIQVVKDEMDPPISEEFGRVLDELNVGVSHERALKHLLDRYPVADIELVVTACQIQASVGGNLAEILDTTATMIRERVRLQGEIQALTAEGRLSAGILSGLPIFLALVVSHLSPGYLNPLVDTRVGVHMLEAACGMAVLGAVVIKKMLAIQI